MAKPVGLWGAYAMGLAFAFGWTPCIGPILAAILAVAASEATVTKGAGLLAVYSAGLGIPFLLAAVAVERFSALFARFKHQLVNVERAMGVLDDRHRHRLSHRHHHPCQHLDAGDVSGAGEVRMSAKACASSVARTARVQFDQHTVAVAQIAGRLAPWLRFRRLDDRSAGRNGSRPVDFHIVADKRNLRGKRIGVGFVRCVGPAAEQAGARHEGIAHEAEQGAAGFEFGIAGTWMHVARP